MRRLFGKLISLILAGTMAFNMTAFSAFADEPASGETTGKYVSDVFIAYGKTEEKAVKWLTDNGWEPIKGDNDFNAGKASYWDDSVGNRQNVAAAMGIRRTDDKTQAITDMAVMNMKGGYSIPDYEALVAEKKTEINEFINRFSVAMEEYRNNYKGKGSGFGKTRADLACMMLNHFYDGGSDEPYKRNDTGEKLGDLFLNKTRQEGNEKGADLEQIILESTGTAIVAVETLLALGADSGEESWLERAAGLTGDELGNNLAKYVPEASGQDVAPSAAKSFLRQNFGDTARVLAEQWTDVHDLMIWYEQYNDANDLWMHDDEDEEAYSARLMQFFDDLKKADEENARTDESRYNTAAVLYNNLYEFPYEGDWGETMGDFFNPADGKDYSTDEDVFLPLAAALSQGQKACLDFISLTMLLMTGFGDEKAFKQAMPDLAEILGDDTEISVYAGVNRAAFRGGVAMTSEALMEQNAGRGAAFDRIWDHNGIVAISTYAAAVIGAVGLVAGTVMAVKGVKTVGAMSDEMIRAYEIKLEVAQESLAMYQKEGFTYLVGKQEVTVAEAERDLAIARGETVPTRMGYAGRVFMGVGGALLIASAIVSAVRLYKYYQRKFTPIPNMIVDESDIVTYLVDDNGKPILDENGEQKKNIDFNTYEYYTSVKCNRPDVGEIGDWQDGVSDYKKEDHYCYDIADLNADMGQEWLALYTVKSESKGDPILADSLRLQYGKKDMPDGCTRGLHLFTYTNTLDLGDTAWAFNNKKKGVYFFWDEEKGAFAAPTASAFTRGQMALAGILGLVLGAGGAVLVGRSKRRKKDEPEEAA